MLLCLALCCSLFGCGKPMPAETTAGEVTIAEPATRAAFVKEGVSWQLLDLRKNTNLKEQAIEWYDALGDPKKGEIRLSDSKVVFMREFPEQWQYALNEIVLRDEKTSKETILLKGNGKEGVDIIAPIIHCGLDERYFVFGWYGWESYRGCSVYDTQEMREIPVERPSGEAYFYSAANGFIYLSGSYDEKIHAYQVDLNALKTGAPLVAEELLENATGNERVAETHNSAFSPNGHYFAVGADSPHSEIPNSREMNMLFVFDLHEKKLLLRMPQPDGLDELECLYYMHFVDEQTLYWYSESSHAVEIILP